LLTYRADGGVVGSGTQGGARRDALLLELARYTGKHMDEKQDEPMRLLSVTALSVVGQVVLLPVAAVSCFSNVMMRLMLIAIVAYWALAIAIWRRREKGLSREDLFLLKWGFYIVFIVTYGLAPLVAATVGGY
jgi:hypothetical protein